MGAAAATGASAATEASAATLAGSLALGDWATGATRTATSAGLLAGTLAGEAFSLTGATTTGAARSSSFPPVRSRKNFGLKIMGAAAMGRLSAGGGASAPGA